MSPILILAFAAQLALAHKDGAPTSACLTMAPGHPDTKPQSLTSALHKLEFAPAPPAPVVTANGANSADGGTVYMVTLGAKSAPANFKGFFVQARSTMAGDVNPVGEILFFYYYFYPVYLNTSVLRIFPGCTRRTQSRRSNRSPHCLRSRAGRIRSVPWVGTPWHYRRRTLPHCNCNKNA